MIEQRKRGEKGRGCKLSFDGTFFHRNLSPHLHAIFEAKVSLISIRARCPLSVQNVSF